MTDFLKNFRIELTVKAPLHIGSGETIGKKEYIWCGKTKDQKILWGKNPPNTTPALFLPRPEKIYKTFEDAGKAKLYEEYLMAQQNIELYDFCRKAGVTPSDEDWGGYLLDMPKIQKSYNGKTFNEISAFVKDAYGEPYIPGSSLKGALRTIIFADLISRPEYAETVCEAREKLLKNSPKIEDIISKLETELLRTLNRDKDTPSNATNDALAALRISDSLPLKLSDLTITKKIDRHISNEKGAKPPPTFRECLKPGVTAIFEMTVDTSLLNGRPVFDGYFETKLQQAIEKFALNYKTGFRDKFYHEEEQSKEKKTKLSPQFEQALAKMSEKDRAKFLSQYRSEEEREEKKEPEQNPHSLYLGGGSGFFTKVVLMSVFGEQSDQMLGFVRKYMENAYPEHRHSKDNSLGVSPHMIKETEYDGKIYEMGLCDVTIKEL